MKKIVPDPPLPSTSAHPFGRCDAGHEPLFAVNPNISAEDALVHVACTCVAPTKPATKPWITCEKKAVACSGRTCMRLKWQKA